MTNEQLKHAIELHDTGVSWSIIASLNKICPTTLRKHLKDYENTTSALARASTEESDIHRTIGTG